MFEQTFKNIDDILHKDAGCTSELDYTEQSSWLLFLKYLDALEADKATEAVLEGRDYQFILSELYRWSAWAAPKGADGKIDHNAALTGDDLKAFVNAKLFPYLAGFKQRASGPQTIEYKIGEVFSEITNKIQSGYNLRDVIDRIDELRFGSQAQKHELSHLYEAKIKNMGNAGRNGGEYYTPRPLIRAMIDVVQPHIGERIYDAACGSAGANVTRGIVPIRFASEKISHQFGYYLLRSEPAQLQIQAKTYGTALQQINIRDLRQLTLPVPAPQDQEIIVQRLSALEEETKTLTAAYENKLTALDDLKKSLLHQAFSGQL